METILLGRTVKAMYKLSGKTIEQISEETELSVDTINNFFYARLQKPSFIGVTKLVKATGFTMKDLVGFMDVARDLPQDTNFTDEFTKYMLTVNDTEPVAVAAVEKQKACTPDSDSAEIIEIYRKELDRLHKTIAMLIAAMVVIALIAIIL